MFLEFNETVQERTDELVALLEDFYEILGVSKKATQEQIKKAYRKRAMRYHPDRCPGPLGALIYSKVDLAFRTLEDPKSRLFYNATSRAAITEYEVRQKAIGLASHTLQELCDTFCKDMSLAKTRLGRIDIPKSAAQKIGEDIEGLEKEQKLSKEFISRNKELRKRFSKKTKNFNKTILGVELLRMFENANRTMHLRVVDIQIANLAIEVIEEYGYEVDEEVVQKEVLSKNYIRIDLSELKFSR